MKLLYLTMASLLEASAIPGYTDCDTARDNLCEFDIKTGLRKQCIRRYVLDISNPSATDYQNALAADPSLTKGSETSSCYPQAEVDAVMLKHNVKDDATTVTNSYTKIDIPAGTAYSDDLPKPTTLEEWKIQQLDLINKLRARHGALPLVLDDDLSAAAQA